MNANHVIFVSPLLAKSQYQYDSAMAQATARSRRYRQKKKVSIYHFAALRTIDVDILEHRHKRFDGIYEEDPENMPLKKLSKRAKTKVVQNAMGLMTLIPVAWLADDSICEAIGIEADSLDSFTSLINFSEAFADDDE